MSLFVLTTFRHIRDNVWCHLIWIYKGLCTILLTLTFIRWTLQSDIYNALIGEWAKGLVWYKCIITVSSPQMNPDLMYGNISAQSTEQDEHRWSKLHFNENHTADLQHWDTACSVKKSLLPWWFKGTFCGEFVSEITSVSQQRHHSWCVCQWVSHFVLKQTTQENN